MLRGSTRQIRDKAMCTRTIVEEIDKVSQRRKLGGQVLRGTTRKVRDKARCKQASSKGIYKASQR